MESYTKSEPTSSLKYERTQNRDIMNTLERINRSVQYASDTEVLLNEIVDSISVSMRKEFKRLWRNKSETHDNPPPFAIEISIGSPISRKHSPIDGNDAAFSYMTMSVGVVFTVSSEISDIQQLAYENTKHELWFSENLSSGLSRRLSEVVSEAVGKSPFVDRFYFSSLDEERSKGNDCGDKNGTIGAAIPKPNTINVGTGVAMQLKNMNGEGVKDYCAAVESDLVHDGLVANISIAFAKLDENR